MKGQRVLGSLKMCCVYIHSSRRVHHLCSAGATQPHRSRVASPTWFHASPFSTVMLLVPTGLTSLTKTVRRRVLWRPATEWSTTFGRTEHDDCISPDKQGDFDVWCVLDVAWRNCNELANCPGNAAFASRRLGLTLSTGGANMWMDGRVTELSLVSCHFSL